MQTYPTGVANGPSHGVTHSRARTGSRTTVAAAAAIALVASLIPGMASAEPGEPPGADRELSVDVVSGPADMATGGDALVRIDVPRNVPPHQVRVRLNGQDVRDAFEPVEDGRTLLGLVDGLELGDNTLSVTSSGRGFGRPSVASTITNHPIEGPVFSGPHIPLYCSADTVWQLGEVDDNCHVVAPTVTYQYRTTGGSWSALPDGPLPDDLATATTSAGETVPYIVRIERGTINRAVYETAILHEPGTPEPDPWNSTPGWNERLVYTFGGGCGIGYRQANNTGGVLNHTLLSRGYATASSTFNVYSNNCNDVTSAETAMMVKEHFIESYGGPRFTMGWGGSAGTMQQLLIANAYPGIIDGVIGQVGYPDERSTTVTGHECRFITQALAGTELDWTAEQGRAVTGQAAFQLPGTFGPNTCFGYQFFDGVDWPQTCPSQIPPADRYDPDDNPDGIRCAIADFVSNVYGTDPETGFGRPIIPSTVGVQYGLQALEDEVISAEQFVDLNERIGGLDVEANRTTERTTADPEAIEIAYATGRVNQFDGALRWTPIIEIRPYTDPGGDFHDSIRSWSMRERLLKANGDAFNHVSWIRPSGTTSPAGPIEALELMDAWLTERTELAGSDTALDEYELTRRSKPEAAVDGCVDTDGTFIAEPLTLEGSQCNELYPYHGTPRMAAGGPASNDVISCTLTDHDRDAYPLELTDDQWERLQTVFPDGVCDWSQPGVGQVPLAGTWIRF